ncbi:divisome protein SepX/GlpR [Mycolicibacter icosiumassiliensis]|uniref:divisome protein SepX/GlpR n=1 Tax=Mycolicibacter icosiumassiliensis TaxID=1792835 RepID=UPI000831D73C|nr:gephyrin-like molybdotransferase receptor GlpR [Mycolicibacter icosiumassiliensis]
MPSIPQSLLWISLVVLWLFVLVPMLVSKRDAVRRTSDVALATRVLTSGSSARLLKRGGPATGHRSDPDWQHSAENIDDVDDIDDVDEVEGEPAGSRVFVAAAAVFVASEPQVGEQTQLDYLDVDVVADDSDELPLSDAGLAAEVEAEARAQAEAQAAAEAEARAAEEAALAAEALAAKAETQVDEGAYEEPAAEGEGYEYEYVEDSSGLEPEAETTRAGMAGLSARGRRPRADTAAVVSARKYEFRKRVLMSLAVILVLSALTAFTVAPTAWWICAGAAGATVLYLAYLRRQTRIEQQVRSRRARRAERPRMQRESVHTDAFEVVPSRLRRPGVAVLEIDDEDPVFEHLEYTSSADRYGWRGDLARASGQ